MNLSSLLAVRTHALGVNAIREILKVVSQPGMISLAGGIPAPESFPEQIMMQLFEKVMATFGAEAMQYGPTEGFGPLREALVDHLTWLGIQADSREILISSGSQGALDAIGMAFITKGDRVAVEAPTYIGALQAFKPYRPVFRNIATDEAGVIPEALEALLKKEKIKFVYLVPTFQNPTGRTLSLDRRQAIAKIIQQHDVLLVEDDPYSSLRYRGEHLPPIKRLAPEHVIYVSTLSKVFAPGLRVGFYVAPEILRKWLVIVKQGVDLHTSTLGQALAFEYLRGGHLKKHLPRIVGWYRPKQEAMLRAMARYFPEKYHWSKPEGGMFIWVKGICGTNMVDVYQKAIKRKVAFVPGTYFYAQSGQGLETMRLNFTMADEPTITLGISILAQVLDESNKTIIPGAVSA